MLNVNGHSFLDKGHRFLVFPVGALFEINPGILYSGTDNE